MPAGFAASEVVSTDSDHYGIRRSYVFRGDCAVLQQLSDELTLLSAQAPPIAAHLLAMRTAEASLPALPAKAVVTAAAANVDGTPVP
eukprot:4055828-Lingulodinium_polyedra.AAC.1